MKRHIEMLRQKPEHVRKQIAFFTSLGVAVVMFTFWFASMGAGSGANAVGDGEVKAVLGANEVLTPAANLKASVLDAFDSIKKSFTGFGESSYSAGDPDESIEVVPGKE